MWQETSPFKNKNAQELDKMFRNKGFVPEGRDCLKGRGNYINPKNQRQYHIDPKDTGRYREPNHIDVSRPKEHFGDLSKKRFGYLDD